MGTGGWWADHSLVFVSLGMEQTNKQNVGGCMYRRRDECLDGWRGECMDGWVDEWMIWANFRTLSANEAKVLTFLRKFTLLNVHAFNLYKGLSLYDPKRRRPW